MKYQKDIDSAKEKWVHGYEKMLEKVEGYLVDFEENSAPRLHDALHNAKKNATIMAELTKKEADEIGQYLKRDLHEAADYLKENGSELQGWLKLDIELIERRFLDLFASAADKTRIELGKLAENAREASFYHTGEVSSPGCLECVSCGQLLKMHKTTHIPPCPKCHKTDFKRSSKRPPKKP